jgi:hypothetical protein
MESIGHKEFRHFERVAPLAISLDEDVLDYLWSFLDLKDYPQESRMQDPDFVYLLEVVSWGDRSKSGLPITK